MNNLFRLGSIENISRAFVIGHILLISGCASFYQPSCAQFDEIRKETSYSTKYRINETDTKRSTSLYKPLTKGTPAAVHLYKLQPSKTTIEPCNHLMLHKEIFLQRTSKSTLVLEETREFYAADGTLIAKKNEDVSGQFLTSGYYAADIPLPIPESAPPGKYRIVSKLLLKSGKNKAWTVLAKTSANFQVLPRH